MLAIVNVAREYPLLCEALGHKDWLQDERFCDITQAMQHRDLFYRMMCEAFESQAYDDIAGRLEHLVTFAEAQTMADVIADEQLRANGIIVETGEDGATIRSP